MLSTRRLYRPALAVATLAVATLATPVSAQAALTTTPTVDNSTRAGALAAYRSYHEAAKAVPTGWTGSAATCSPGTVSAGSAQATVTTINYYRSMVGLKPAVLDATWSAKAQSAAVLMTANGTIDHHPTSAWRCYTPAAAATAAVSNLGLNYPTGAASVDGYLDERGAEALLGHRRWLLDPRVTRVGSGQTANANVLKLWDAPLPTANPAGAPAYIAWPDAGYVPKTIVPSTNTWSFSANDAAVVLSVATVRVTTAGTAVPVTVSHLPNGYGKPALAFRPATGYTGGSDKSFTITVSGMRRAGVTLPAYTYTTTLFDPAYSLSPQSISFISGQTGLTGQRGTLAARSTTGRPVAFTSTTPTVCTVAGAGVTYLTTGRCTVRATVSGNATWAAASAAQTVYVGSPAKRANAISWAQPATVAAGRTAALAAKASSGLAVAYTSSTPLVCTVAGATVTYRAGGTCSVTAVQPGSASVNEAAPAVRSWVVTGAKANAITWTVPTTVAAGTTIKRNPTTLSGSGAFTFTMSMNALGVCAFGANNTIVFSKPGRCTISVTQPATATFQGATTTRAVTVG